MNTEVNKEMLIAKIIYTNNKYIHSKSCKERNKLHDELQEMIEKLRKEYYESN
jgi:hypothetical protein